MSNGQIEEKESCKTCKFWIESCYECRRHAPRLIVEKIGDVFTAIRDKQNPGRVMAIQQKGVEITHRESPKTGEDYWCGDYEQR